MRLSLMRVASKKLNKFGFTLNNKYYGNTITAEPFMENEFPLVSPS